MLESLKQNETFEYQKLTAEEMKARGILGRLIGPCADFINPTRNGRKYGEELWERVFEDPIMQEKIENGVCFGELGHPADRTETDMEKIAVCLREQPKKNKDGLLVACFDILDTPNGRILKTLCDYGTTIGVSSRGTGDLITDDEGNEVVDPETYECECWDVVLVPAVKCARMDYVTESLDKNMLNLKKALCESLGNATESERKIMTETLDTLNIKVEEELKEEEIPNEEESIPEEGGDKNAESETSETNSDKTEEANNDGSDEIIKSLQESIREKSVLEGSVKSLQEQLAVANDKVNKFSEELGKLKQTMENLKESNSKELNEKISTLEEELKAKEQTIESQKSRINKLVESRKAEVNGTKSLNEAISKKEAELKTLNESFDEIKTTYEEKIKNLTESIETMKSDSESKDKEYCEKLNREEKLKENYKKIAKTVVNRYIESKATALGVKVDEIKNKLPESYTIDDIDSICEELQSYALNISKLPFNVDRKVKVKVRESKNETLSLDKEVDEDVDDSLYRLAKLN